MDAEALLLTGTVGAGKSTAADRVGMRLRSRGVPSAVIDLDSIRNFWPTPAGDRFGSAMELRNLAPLVANFLAGGTERIVLAGVCESRRDRDRYAEVLGVPLTVCRLRVNADQLARRLRIRHADDQDGLAWHLARTGELDGILDRAGVADVDLDVHTMTPDQVADAVLSAVGWA